MVKRCILFTDIKSSSKLWGKYPKQMPKLLAAHEQIIRRVVTKHGGLILKTIGDAVMVEFLTALKGAAAAIDMQTAFHEKPLVFNHTDQLQIRIGLAFGDIHVKNIMIQNHKLRDVFGHFVNLASRMESKVSLVGGFGILDKHLDKQTLELLEKKCVIKQIFFVHKCDKKVARSTRLLSECQSLETLHINDNKEYTALSCTLKF